jgi:hypothetical protein
LCRSRRRGCWCWCCSSVALFGLNFLFQLLQ